MSAPADVLGDMVPTICWCDNVQYGKDWFRTFRVNDVGFLVSLDVKPEQVGAALFPSYVTAVVELVGADKEYDAANDALAEAKREKSNWSVNPLRPNHPAVLRSRAAADRRRAALAKFGGGK